MVVSIDARVGVVRTVPVVAVADGDVVCCIVVGADG